jgi:hypothetical protein
MILGSWLLSFLPFSLRISVFPFLLSHFWCLIAPVPAAPTVDLSKYEKYEKMKKMLPEGAVRQKMKMDNFTDAEIDSFFDGSYLTAAPAGNLLSLPRVTSVNSSVCFVHFSLVLPCFIS